MKEFIYANFIKMKVEMDGMHQNYENFYYDLGFKLNLEKFKNHFNSIGNKIYNIEMDLDLMENNDIFFIL